MLLVLTWVSLGFVAFRRRRDWKKRRFGERVNVSLNRVADTKEGGLKLELRTLMEDSAHNVWLNRYGVRRVLAAAARTTTEQPFLSVEPVSEMEQINRAVLNTLSERFAEAFLARSLGLDVVEELFLFGVCWERYGDIHDHKLRVVVIRPEDLERICSADALEVDEPSHAARITTLRAMAALKAAPESRLIGEVRLGIALHGRISSRGG